MSVEIYEKLLDDRAELMGMLLQGKLADMGAYTFDLMKELKLEQRTLMLLYRAEPDEDKRRNMLIKEFKGNVSAANGFDLLVKLQDEMLEYLKILAFRASHENPASMELNMRRIRDEFATNYGEVFKIGDAQAKEIFRRFETVVTDKIAEIQGRGPAG
jgi:hypothetical protein